MGYSVAYIYEEMEETRPCADNSTESALPECKEADVESSTPIVINSSHSLAFVFPEDASQSYLYEIERTSLGVISSPSPAQVPQVGEMFELAEQMPRQIPQRLFQMILEPLVSSQS